MRSIDITDVSSFETLAKSQLTVAFNTTSADHLSSRLIYYASIYNMSLVISPMMSTSRMTSIGLRVKLSGISTGHQAHYRLQDQHLCQVHSRQHHLNRLSVQYRRSEAGSTRRTSTQLCSWASNWTSLCNWCRPINLSLHEGRRNT